MNQLTPAQNNTPTTYSPPASEVIKSDVLIPKITLMQAMSDLCTQGKAKPGQMVRSSNSQSVGDEKNPLEVIPLTIKNDWLVSRNEPAKNGKDNFKFSHYEARTAANEGFPWDFEVDGVKHKRTKILTLFALLPVDIEKERAMVSAIEAGEMPDVDGVLLPVAISFKGASFKAAREISTLFAKSESISRQVGKTIPPYGSTIVLTCTQETNDNGTFFTYSAKASGKTKAEYLTACKQWHNTLSTSAVKVDEEAVEVDVPKMQDVGF